MKEHSSSYTGYACPAASVVYIKVHSASVASQLLPVYAATVLSHIRRII
ncbi:MAG: hypothetical protein FWE84_03640 [Firmicutes bacterium]|nr:hypothetical protein [Bacillota bacterium]